MPFSRRLPEVLRVSERREREREESGATVGAWQKQTRLTEWKRQRRVDTLTVLSLRAFTLWSRRCHCHWHCCCHCHCSWLHATATASVSNPALPSLSPLLPFCCPFPFALLLHSLADSKWSAWPLGSASSLDHSELRPCSSNNNNKGHNSNNNRGHSNNKQSNNNREQEQQQQQLLTNVLCLPLRFDFVLSIRSCHKMMQGM